MPAVNANQLKIRNFEPFMALLNNISAFAVRTEITHKYNFFQSFIKLY